MIDYYGNWTWNPMLSEDKWCDCDYLAKWISDSKYNVETTIENLVHMILLHFDCCDNYGEYDPETGFGGYGDGFTLEECKRYVIESGGFREFDYRC